MNANNTVQIIPDKSWKDLLVISEFKSDLDMSYNYDKGSDWSVEAPFPGPDIVIGRCLNPHTATSSSSVEFYDYDVVFLGGDYEKVVQGPMSVSDEEGEWITVDPGDGEVMVKYALFEDDVLVKATDIVDVEGTYVWKPVCTDYHYDIIK